MNYIEIRIVVSYEGEMQLQYRVREPQCDASGAICGFDIFGRWQVATVLHSDIEFKRGYDTFGKVEDRK